MKKFLISTVISAVVHEVAKDAIHAWFAQHGGECPCRWLGNS